MQGMSAKPAVGSEPHRRSHDRVDGAFPVSIDGVQIGWTENLSPSGIFFVTQQELLPGAAIDLSIEFDSAGGKLMLQCRGEVVRIEPRHPHGGIAVKITASRL